MHLYTREYAWKILTEWTEGARLRRHALAVEACMRWYAKKYGEDPDLWRNMLRIVWWRFKLVLMCWGCRYKIIERESVGSGWGLS